MSRQIGWKARRTTSAKTHRMIIRNHFSKANIGCINAFCIILHTLDQRMSLFLPYLQYKISKNNVNMLDVSKEGQAPWLIWRPALHHQSLALVDPGLSHTAGSTYHGQHGQHRQHGPKMLSPGHFCYIYDPWWHVHDMLWTCPNLPMINSSYGCFGHSQGSSPKPLAATPLRSPLEGALEAFHNRWDLMSCA